MQDLIKKIKSISLDRADVYINHYERSKNFEVVVEIPKYSRYSSPEIENSYKKHLEHLNYCKLSSQTYMTSLRKRPYMNKWVIVVDHKMYNRKTVISNILKQKNNG